MKRESNEDENDIGLPSIRRKYQGGRNSKSKINYGVVMKSSKQEFSEGGAGSGMREEKIIIKKESKTNRGIAASPVESSSKITTKTVIQGGDGTKSRSQVTVTKTEITESQRGGNTGATTELKGVKGSRITSKTTEITTSSTMNTGNNRNGSQGRKVKEETTTKTITTTSKQGGSRGQSMGNKEIVKTVTNQVNESGSSQRKVRGGKEEITTTTTTTKTNQRGGNQTRSSQKDQTTATTTKTTTTTTNQRTSSRGPSQGQKAQVVKEVITETSINRRNSGTQGTKTTTKTVTTAQGQGRASRTKEANSSSLTTTKTTQINAGGTSSRTGLKSSQVTTVNKTTESRDKRFGDNTTTTTKRTLANQKSTPALRVSNQVTDKTTLKDTAKRPLSSRTDINRDNIVRITIDETGKIPKKTYVLNVRKLDRIQQDRRQRLVYSNKMDEKEAVQTNFNHNIIVIKNITKESRTVNPNLSNIAQKVINESGKIPKKKVQVSPRKNEVIKSVKKPLKLTYENYVETNTSSTTTNKKDINKIPVPPTRKKMEVKENLKSKLGGGEQISRGNSSSKRVETETKSSRIKQEGSGNKTTTTTTTTTTKTETNTRIGRNKSEANMNKSGSGESKVTITKTKITTGGKGKKYGQLEISSSHGTNSTENGGASTRLKSESSNSRGGKKVETITTKQVVTERSGSRTRSGGEGASGSKVTTVKKTEVSYGTNGKESGNSRSNSRVKQETTTTTTKTVTKTSKVEAIGEGEGGQSVVKKFRSVRRMKK